MTCISVLQDVFNREFDITENGLDPYLWAAMHSRTLAKFESRLHISPDELTQATLDTFGDAIARKPTRRTNLTLDEFYSEMEDFLTKPRVLPTLDLNPIPGPRLVAIAPHGDQNLERNEEYVQLMGFEAEIDAEQEL